MLVVHCVYAFGLNNNNKWRWWLWMAAAYSRWPRYDDSIINIVTGVSISIMCIDGELFLF